MASEATPDPSRRRAAPQRRGLRRALLAVAALAPLAQGVRAAAAPGQRRIAVLADAWAADHPTVLGLKAGLREQGFDEGRDLSYDVRFTQGRPDAAPGLARALAADGADALFALGTACALAAKAAAPELPVVFAQVGDPVALGLVADLARPGGQVTGVSGITADLLPKRVEILKTLRPGLRRVWMVAPTGDAMLQAALPALFDAAGALGVAVEPAEVEARAEPELAPLRKALRPDDGLLAPGVEALGLAAALLKLSLAARVPAVFPSSLWVGYGGLVSYGPDFFALGTQAARLVAKVLGGARPAELPVESADVLDLALNLGTASAMSITVPRKILLRASTIRR